MSSFIQTQKQKVVVKTDYEKYQDYSLAKEKEWNRKEKQWTANRIEMEKKQARTLRNRDKRNRQKDAKTLRIIETLPQEVKGLIFFDGILSFFEVAFANGDRLCQYPKDDEFQYYSRVQYVRYFLNLRLINTQAKGAVDNFCIVKMQRYNICGEVDRLKLFCHIQSYSTDTTIEDGTHIVYAPAIRSHHGFPVAFNMPSMNGKDLYRQLVGTKCIDCHREDGYLKYKPKTNNHWVCLTGCRKYYCHNRNCEDFAQSVTIYNFNRFKSGVFGLDVCCEGVDYGERGCGKSLEIEKVNEDKERCRMLDEFAPGYAKCNTQLEGLTMNACHKCRKDFWEDEWSEDGWSDDDF